MSYSLDMFPRYIYISARSLDRVRLAVTPHRSMIIFRDPRDVMTSEYAMRTSVLFNARVAELSLEEYTRQRFEVSIRGLWRQLLPSMRRLS